MSSLPRGRGRGRGIARPSSSRELSPPTTASLEALRDAEPAYNGDNSNTLEDTAGDPSQASTSASTSTSGPARPASAIASGGPTLLRKNVYTGSSKMKFMPTMVKRRAQSAVQVKEEEVELSLSDPFSGRGSGRGRGRGRGRGEGKEGAGRGRGQETQMYATGAFSHGPAAQDRPKRSFGPSTGWASGGPGGGGGGGGGYGGGGGTTSTAALVDSDPEDYGDADENGEGGGRKNKTVDLFDIGMENEMAPLVLPRDEKKWLEEEKLRKENEKAMAKLKLGPAAGAKSVKMDPYEEEEMAAASLAGTPTASASATPAPSAHTLEEAAPIEDAAVLGADDVKITVKRENISTYFNLSQEESAHEQFYVFQFPRLFPQFVEPGSVPDVKPSANDLLSSLIESKHKVKSAYHESEAEAWRDYIPGKWQGWGKNPGREGREILGATDAQAQGGNQPQAPEGRIGKIKVRRSGRTTLKLGGIEYDILPGAPANFLQEVAVLEDAAVPEDDEKPGRGMYIMGQASKKFVITPELGKLLQQDAVERVERARLMKEEAEMKAKKAKEEELESKLSTQTAKAKRPTGKPAPRPKPGAAPTASAARPRPAAAANKPTK